jgi:hypothetical protein
VRAERFIQVLEPHRVLAWHDEEPAGRDRVQEDHDPVVGHRRIDAGNDGAPVSEGSADPGRLLSG